MKRTAKATWLWCGLLLIGACTVSAAAQQGETLFGIEGAPEGFRQDNVGVIMTTSPDIINEACRGDRVLPEGTIILACTKGRNMLMPNPCLYQDMDPYARLLCHEMAHLPRLDNSEGWKHAPSN